MKPINIVCLIIIILFLLEEVLYIFDRKNIFKLKFCHSYFEIRKNNKIFDNVHFFLGMGILIVMWFILD
ncbi:Uncharacterised protein [Eubacterium limosum]|jgi:hypothetical protein|uniref:Uncharacterized protein n=1 Tax=Eubacterium limosum TaxID=1736 RepID=A0AAC9QRB5_EUBLI|nr:hypothetical protein B2M23_01115 [Eubacterium limosum]PWW60082.1 hypothetical protein C7955_101483 [Eubacterium limosum]